MDELGASQIVPALLRGIEWVVVPLVLISLWCYGFFLPEKAPSKAAKASGGYARGAGLLIFILFVLGRKREADTLALLIPEYDLNWLLIAVGLVVGCAFFFLMDRVKYVYVVSVVVLVLVASMSIALYSYFFVSGVRVPILFLALGFALGTMLEKAFLRVHSLYEQERRSPGEDVKRT